MKNKIMKTIYKYKTEVARENWLDLPADAEVLTCQIQNGELCLWAIVETDNAPTRRLFSVFGTGHPIFDKLEYIATVQENHFVWHIFEEIL